MKVLGIGFHSASCRSRFLTLIWIKVEIILENQTRMKRRAQKKPSEIGELGGDGDRGLYFNRSVRTECEVLVVRDIAELVGQALCVADEHILVVMGVAVYPIVYSAGDYVVRQFDGEHPVGTAVGKSRVLHPERGDMVGDDYLV